MPMIKFTIALMTLLAIFGFVSGLFISSSEDDATTESTTTPAEGGFGNIDELARVF